eukprot:2479519-Pyramimonas_sp.AAC.2
MIAIALFRHSALWATWPAAPGLTHALLAAQVPRNLARATPQIGEDARVGGCHLQVRAARQTTRAVELQTRRATSHLHDLQS